MNIYELLRADGSIIVNKKLARAIGLEPAIMFSELLSKHYYFEAKGQLQDGWFFNSIEDMQKDTCLTAYHQRKSIDKLKELELIECELRGMPATRFFKVNPDQYTVVKILTSDIKNLTSDIKNLTKEVKKRHLNNTNTRILNKNTNDNKNDMGKALGNQNTLFNVKVEEKKTPSVKKKKLSHKEQSERNISLAYSGEIEWQKVSNRDFTYYYIKRHEEILGQTVAFDRYSSVTIIKNFIEMYDIPRDKVCQYIDEILKLYETHPKRADYPQLTFNMLAKYQTLVNDLVRRAEMACTPSERTLPTLTIKLSDEELKDAPDVF